MGTSLVSGPQPHADERIAELTRQGLSARQIADRVGMTTRTVCRARRRMGLSKPIAPRMSPAELTLAQSLLDDGASIEETARTLGRAHATITHHFPDAHVLTPKEISERANLGRAAQRILGIRR